MTPRLFRKARKPRVNTTQEEWSAGEEVRLRQLAGKLQVRDIADVLTGEFGVPRTRAAVSVRARILNISLWWDGYSQNQVAAAFGVWFKTVEHWRDDGLLKAEAWRVGRGRFGQWHFREADVAAFIDHCTWAYGVERMPAGPLRSRAEVAHRAEPWLTVEQLVDLWHVNARTIRLWVAQGRIPHKRRQAGVGLPKIVVRAADLPGLRQQLRDEALVNLRAAIRLRDERRRAKAA
jgi:hypothetical protein